jgi:DNA topoisomerase-3
MPEFRDGHLGERGLVVDGRRQRRIIGKLKNGSPAGGRPLSGSGFGGAAGDRPPTSPMKRYAEIIARQKRIRPPPGYGSSGAICRAFLEQHAPKKAADDAAGLTGTKPASPAQLSFAEQIAREKGAFIPDDAKASSAAMSAWIESNQVSKIAKGRRKISNKRAGLAAGTSSAKPKRIRKSKAAAAPSAAPSSPSPVQQNAVGNTPLRIPYGNKELAQKLGARYAAGGWYAPPGVDLSAFSAKGWL